LKARRKPVSTNLQRTLELHKNLPGADLLITADVPVLHPSDGTFMERYRVVRGDFGGSGLVKDRSHRDGPNESVVADRWRIRLADVAWWCTTVLNL
jgi:hypothetical protein